jgi:hypothetical protein
MFENKKQKVISRKHYFNRQLRFAWYAFLLLAISLAIGVVGYSVTEDLPFLDSLLNASMILTGMGPVNQMTNDSSKLFASLYAIYSGVAFLTGIGVFIAPAVHRFMHKIQLEEE